MKNNPVLNLRALLNWGLIGKELKPGKRKEFFAAEKDMGKVAGTEACESLLDRPMASTAAFRQQELG